MADRPVDIENVVNTGMASIRRATSSSDIGSGGFLPSFFADALFMGFSHG